MFTFIYFRLCCSFPYCICYSSLNNQSVTFRSKSLLDFIAFQEFEGEMLKYLSVFILLVARRCLKRFHFCLNNGIKLTIFIQRNRVETHVSSFYYMYSYLIIAMYWCMHNIGFMNNHFHLIQCLNEFTFVSFRE